MLPINELSWKKNITTILAMNTPTIRSTALEEKTLTITPDAFFLFHIKIELSWKKNCKYKYQQCWLWILLRATVLNYTTNTVFTFTGRLESKIHMNSVSFNNKANNHGKTEIRVREIVRSDTRLVFCNRKLMRTDIILTRTTKPICNFTNSVKYWWKWWYHSITI